MAGCVAEQILSPVVVEANGKASFDLNMDGSCAPQIITVSNKNKDQNEEYVLTVNSFDTITYNEPYVLYELGVHEIELNTISASGHCRSSFSQIVELTPGLSDRVSPQILETFVDSNKIEFIKYGR